MKLTRLVYTWIAIVIAFCSACRPKIREVHPTTTPNDESSGDLIAHPIKNDSQAIEAAQRFISTTRLRTDETPKAVFVDYLSYPEAKQILEKSKLSNFTENVSDQMVWLVILKGHWHVEGVPQREVTLEKSETQSPKPSSTSIDQTSNCVYAILVDAEGGSAGGIGSCEFLDELR